MLLHRWRQKTLITSVKMKDIKVIDNPLHMNQVNNTHKEALTAARWGFY